jgi:sirohydrochlorin cobaltochelatase
MSRTALVVFAHGARDPLWAEPMERVSRSVREQAPDIRVEVAFLEFMKPDLRACAEALLAEGFEHIIVLPMFIARGGHLRRDLPLLLEELRQRNPHICFELAGAIGEAEAVVQAMARHALALVRSASVPAGSPEGVDGAGV